MTRFCTSFTSELVWLEEQHAERAQAANIGGDLIESLGEGLRNFGETAQSLNSVGTASEATESLFSSIENASQSVDKMSDAYSQASESLSGMANLKGESDSYAEQLVTMTKNLGELAKDTDLSKFIL